MKKALKKLMAALLATALVLAMAIPAFAAVDLSTHSFEAYQVFTGKLDSNNKLSNVDWGTGVDGDALLAALKNDMPEFAACASAKDVAETLSNLTEAKATEFAAFIVNHSFLTSTKAEGTGTVYLPAAGYYLIKDVTDVQGKDDALNLTLLKVSGPETVTPKVKTDKPTVVKKVKDTNDTTEATTGWQDSADYDIGDTIPYQLTATLGDVSNYSTYYVEFVDTMEHLTFKAITSVTVDGTLLNAGDYAYNWDNATKTLTVSIDDVKAHGATNKSKIVVEYTATLDADAVLGAAGNPNEVYLKYSNNPNGTGTGETPKDKNIVFTYQVSADKVDQDGNPLKGAAFALYKKVRDPMDGSSGYTIIEGDSYKLIGQLNVAADGTIEDPDMTQFTWKGLDDGEYLIVEVITPEGYNSIDPVKFTIAANHEAESDDPQLIDLTGGDKFTGTVNDGNLFTKIENRMGSTLPSTGGIGTTIFYVIGGALMVGAAVLLITKKRMESKN